MLNMKLILITFFKQITNPNYLEKQAIEFERIIGDHNSKKDEKSGIFKQKSGFFTYNLRFYVKLYVFL